MAGSQGQVDLSVRLETIDSLGLDQEIRSRPVEIMAEGHLAGIRRNADQVSSGRHRIIQICGALKASRDRVQADRGRQDRARCQVHWIAPAAQGPTGRHWA